MAPRHASDLALVRSIRNLHHQHFRGNVRIRRGPKAVVSRRCNRSLHHPEGKAAKHAAKGKTHCRRGALTQSRAARADLHPPRHRWTASVLAPFPPAGPALRTLASKRCKRPGIRVSRPGRSRAQCCLSRAEGKAKPLRSASSGGVRVNGRIGSPKPNRSHEPGVRRTMALGHCCARKIFRSVISSLGS